MSNQILFFSLFIVLGVFSYIYGQDATDKTGSSREVADYISYCSKVSNRSVEPADEIKLQSYPPFPEGNILLREGIKNVSN